MSELFFEEFEKRKEEAKELPVVKLELTIGNLLLQKYDLVVVGDVCYMIMSRPNRTEAGFTYIVTPHNIPPSDLTATLVDTVLPEL